jgi:hypothetical protein
VEVKMYGDVLLAVDSRSAETPRDEIMGTTGKVGDDGDDDDVKAPPRKLLLVLLNYDYYYYYWW